MLAVEVALLRDAVATLPRSALLIEVASLPAVPVAERRAVVEVPEALLPEEAAEELLPEVVVAERRAVPDCGWTEERLAEVEDCRVAEAALPLVPVVELRRVCVLCAAVEELLRDAVPALLRPALLLWVAAELRDTVAAEERLAEEERETLEELAEFEAELPVLEDLAAELPEAVPAALRLACACKASGVNAIAIARVVTIRDLSKVFIRLIDIILFGD